ncbi:S ribosomal protein L10%2C mitochondrial [Xyrichtys novacula]|nr:S ribosomal protein L10%2C mitochondrial [Xyrichtys novacula]
MHILKQKLMAVTEYIPPPPAAPRGAYPSQSRKVKEGSPLVLLMKKEMGKVFQENKMVAVAQNNGCNAEDMMMLRHSLYKHDIRVRFFPNEVARLFLKESIYCNMTPLFMGPTILIVSKEPKVKEMLKTLRGSPQMTLVGGCIENTLLSVQGLQNYSKLPSVTVVQGELVSGLTMMTSRTASLLQRHPTHLSALLQQYIKQQSSDAGAEAAPKAEEAT